MKKASKTEASLPCVVFMLSILNIQIMVLGRHLGSIPIYWSRLFVANCYDSSMPIHTASRSLCSPYSHCRCIACYSGSVSASSLRMAGFGKFSLMGSVVFCRFAWKICKFERADIFMETFFQLGTIFSVLLAGLSVIILLAARKGNL